MSRLVDVLWESLSRAGVSWVGFYIDQLGQPDDRRLILGARRDKAACSPIGLHGACGQCLVSGRLLVVHDVRELGDRYIACDALDQSEIVLPCVGEDGRVWGVLDLDSHEVGQFTQEYQDHLSLLLIEAGLSVSVSLDSHFNPN